MGVPKRISSKRRKRLRKSGQAAARRRKVPGLRKDAKTGNVHLGHRVDPKTGMYRGRQVLTTTSEE